MSPNHTVTPAIYVASLADYNAGRLNGEWIDACQEADDLLQSIDVILKRSPEPVAEDWAIHDHEGFGPIQLSEWESIETVALLASGIAEHGVAFAHWADYLDQDADMLADFETVYRGEWESFQDYADNLLDDIGDGPDTVLEKHLPAELQQYVRFDRAAYARDLEHDYYIVEAPGRVFVFDPEAAR